MGRFTCTECGCSYYDRRFAWEPIHEEDDCSGSACDGATVLLADVVVLAKPLGDAKEALVLPKAGSSLSIASTLDDASTDNECWNSSDGESSDEDFLAAIGDQMLPWVEAVSPWDDCVNPPSCGGDLHIAEANWTNAVQGARVYADIIRAMGTTANVTATAASQVTLVCQICSPISAFAGIVGFSSGLSQLLQAMLPSGTIDPHLLVKGSITTGVGGSCMVMGALACVHPILFMVALGLGLTGLGAATAVDATVDGVCPACRDTCTGVFAEDVPEDPNVDQESEEMVLLAW
mmetsp:Transcript_97704/g.244853  ORF Transcript_97704/g.244853 Transcript_97704/m.244853 type:complete len:291 (+) Transcript_97704:67-939(+)